MKAVIADRAGGPDVLRIVDLPMPTPSAGQLLVHVAVAGVNFADTMLRRDAYFLPATFPFLPGVEVAGVVESIGDAVDGWSVGERIAGIRLDGGGGYAEYALLDAALAARVPDDLDLNRAVAVLNQGLTAQGLVESAPEIKDGGTALVTAAAGGVGGLLVQLASSAGAALVVAAAGRIDKLTGHTPAIGYDDPQWPKALRGLVGEAGVDVAFDAVGGQVRAAAVRTLAPRGRLIFYGAASGSSGIDEQVITQLLGRSASLTGYSIYTSIREDGKWATRTLERLFGLTASGRIATPIHPPFALADAASAHTAIESRAVRGKVLLKIGE